jgi:hypothetical protein
LYDHEVRKPENPKKLKSNTMEIKFYLKKSFAIALLAILMLLPGLGFGQASMLNYAFSTAKPIIPEDMSSGTTQLIAGTSVDIVSAITDIGFNFNFMGVSYSQFSTNSNGQMRLGSTAIYKNNINSSGPSWPIMVPITGNNYLLSSGKVHYKVIGIIPNRVLIVEWKDLRIPYGTTGTGSQIQALLYETSGKIVFKYGTVSNNATPATTRAILISSSNVVPTVKRLNADMITFSNSAEYPATTFTMNDANTALLNSRSYTFTPPVAPNAPASLTFSNVSQGAMTLNWPDVTGETGYEVFRSDDGGLNYIKVASPLANAITYTQTPLVAGTTYFWRVYALNEGQSSYVQASQATNAAGSITSAATGGLWSSTTTWSGGVVPGVNDNVTIADGATVTINGNVPCGNLTVGQGTSGILIFDGTARTFTVNGSVTVATGASFNAGTAVQTHKIYIGGSANTDLYTGNLTVNGSLDFGSATGKANITFFGLPNAVISGTSGTLNFNTGNTLNKGAITATASVTPPVLDIQRTFTVLGANTSGFLTTHTAGVLKISGTFTGTNPVFATAAYSIPAVGGLWLNNPNFTIGGLAGSPMNNGLLSISNGIYNIGTLAGHTMGGAATGSVFIFEGGTTNIASSLDLGLNISTLYISGSAIINVTTAGNTTKTGFGFGSSSNVINISGGTINLVQSGSKESYNVGGTNPSITGGTLNVGTSATAASFSFYVTGSIPNLVIDNSTNAKTAMVRWATPVTTIYGTATLMSGTTLSYLSNTYSIAFRSTILNNGTLNAIGTLIFQGSVPQTLSGNITNNQIGNLIIDNASGVTITPSVQINSGLTLKSGTLACGGTLTLGLGATSSFDFINTNGGFSVAPTLNYGSFRNTFTYNGTLPQTTGPELPANAIGTDSRLTINNPAGVLLNSPLSILNLTLTAGALTTSSTNLLTIIQASGILRTSGYINGPLIQRLYANTLGNFAYTWPLGKSSYTPFELVNPTTNAGGTVDIQAEVFDANSGGTPGTGIGSLNTDRYWESSITAGAANFTNTTVRVTDAVNIPTSYVLGRSTTKTGTYNQVGNTIVGTTLLSNPLNTLGFFTIGAPCTNPTSGGQIAAPTVTTGCSPFDPNTITSSVLPLGHIGTLEYKWQQSTTSSSSGFSDIVNSNVITYDPAALSMTTWFKRLARVTCQGSWTGAVESNVVMMTVNPVSVGGTVTGGATVCAGTNSTLLTLNGQTGTIINWESSTDGTTWTTIANTASTYTVTNLMATTQYRAVVQSGVCSSAISASATVTVNPVSVGGTVTGGATVCASTNSTLLTLNGQTGTIINWESSPDGTTWTPFAIANTAATYTVTDLTATTQYRAVVQSGACSSANSVSATVTVNPFPSAAATITGSLTYSPGTLGNVYSVAAIPNATSYTWAYSGTGVTINGTGNSVTLDFAAGATGGSLTVLGHNACGDGAVSVAVGLVPIITVNLKVFLEGPFNGTAMNTTLNTNTLIPGIQPYGTIYGTTNNAIPADVVDWVLVELRQAIDPANAGSGTIFAQRAAFLKSNGTIVDLDGTSHVLFNNALLTPGNNLYVVIRHRNHLAIMSAVSPGLLAGVYSYDFTLSGNVYGASNGYKLIIGKTMMATGDANSDGIVNSIDYTDWAINYQKPLGYGKADFGFDGLINSLDYTSWAMSYSSSSDSKLKTAILLPTYFSNVPK